MTPENADRQEQRPGLLQRGWDRLQQFIAADQKKWGGMTFSAMWRLGWAELREAFSFGGNVAQPTPYGMFGTLTPGEVGSARDTRGSSPLVREMEEEPVMAGNNLSPSEIAAGQDRGVRGQEQERAPSQELGSVHGERDKNPSPSQIAANPQLYAQEQQQGHEHEHGMER